MLWNGWKIGYNGEYSLADAFRHFSVQPFELDLSLKSRVQRVCCLSDNVTRSVVLRLYEEDLMYELQRNIAATWGIAISDIELIMTGEVIIEDKFDVMQLKPTDLVTFRLFDQSKF